MPSQTLSQLRNRAVRPALDVRLNVFAIMLLLAGTASGWLLAVQRQLESAESFERMRAMTRDPAEA